VDGYESEKEQIERLKKWWGENGKALLIGLCLGLGGLFGYRYWVSYQIAQGESASITYERFVAMASAGASDEAHEAGEAIIKLYPASTYAKLASMMLAKLDVDVNDYDSAAARLQWVIDAGPDTPIAAVARARIARILLAQGKPDEAWGMLEAGGTDLGRFPDLRGDILLAQGETIEARLKYLQAMEQARETGIDTQIIQLKLDNLSSEATAPQ
jgi:predicted negative regulator of RcsB-dependent stress response